MYVCVCVCVCVNKSYLMWRTKNILLIFSLQGNVYEY